MPHVPWAYAANGDPATWGSVEAVLLGPQRAESGRLDPRALPRLKLVQTLFTGLDGVPLDSFPDSVAVAGNVGAYAPFVAEHAMALALAAARNIVVAQAQVLQADCGPHRTTGSWSSAPP